MKAANGLAKGIIAGSLVVLMAVGPDSLDTVRTHERGGWYSAYAVIMHQACVSGERPAG